MSKNRISDQFPDDEDALQPGVDFGPVLNAASEAFDELTPDEQTAFLQQTEEIRVRQQRQKVADMESQFTLDHGLPTFRKYRREGEIGHETIEVIIAGADGAQHKLQGPQSTIETLPQDECFTEWPTVLFIVNEDGSREKIVRFDEEPCSE